jgi:hypothetical protein
MLGCSREKRKPGEEVANWQGQSGQAYTFYLLFLSEKNSTVKKHPECHW